jgi:hypothetical protein
LLEAEYVEKYHMEKSSENKRQYLLGIPEGVISPHIKLIYVRSGFNKYIPEVSKRWNLHIIIDEKTTINELKDIWWKIEQSRDKLIQFQGTDPKSYSTIILEYVNNKVISKYHYSEISREMNFYSLVFLVWSTANNASEKYRAEGVDIFRNLLKTFQMKDEEVQECENRGMNALKNNDLPWGLDDGPISRRRVIDSLRNHLKKLEKKSIVINPLLNSDKIHIINFRNIDCGYWQKTEGLLRKVIPADFKKYEKDINGLYNEALTVVHLIELNLKISPE